MKLSRNDRLFIKKYFIQKLISNYPNPINDDSVDNTIKAKWGYSGINYLYEKVIPILMRLEIIDNWFEVYDLGIITQNKLKLFSRYFDKEEFDLLLKDFKRRTLLDIQFRLNEIESVERFLNNEVF